MVNYYFLLAISLLGLQLAPHALAEEFQCGTINFAYSIHEPYVIRGVGNTEPTGMEVEIAKLVLGSMGCDLRWNYQTWKRALQNIREGVSDILHSASRTAEREDYGWFSADYRSQFMRVFVRKGVVPDSVLTLRGVVSQENITLAWVNGFSYGRGIDEVLLDNRYEEYFVSVSAPRQAYRMFIENSIDGFIADHISGLQAMKERDAVEKISETEILYDNGKIHYFLSKNPKSNITEQFRIKLDQTINSKRFKIKEIIKKYTKESGP